MQDLALRFGTAAVCLQSFLHEFAQLPAIAKLALWGDQPLGQCLSVQRANPRRGWSASCTSEFGCFWSDLEAAASGSQSHGTAQLISAAEFCSPRTSLETSAHMLQKVSFTILWRSLRDPPPVVLKTYTEYPGCQTVNHRETLFCQENTQAVRVLHPGPAGAVEPAPQKSWHFHSLVQISAGFSVHALIS